MIRRIKLFVWLKTVDLFAQTARATLLQDLGYEGILQGLNRVDLWIIDVETKTLNEARELGREFAEKTKIFVNPNKHRYRLEVDSETLSNKGCPDDLFRMYVVTSFRDDVREGLAKDTLQTTLGYKAVTDVKKKTVWELLIKASRASEAWAIAEEIAVCKEVTKGLLVNPHSQEYEILDRAP